MLSKAKLIDELQFILSQSESLCTITCPTADGYRMGAEDVFNHLQMLGVLKIDAAEASTQPPLQQAAVMRAQSAEPLAAGLQKLISGLDAERMPKMWTVTVIQMLKKLQQSAANGA